MTEAMLATKPKICTILPFKEKSAGLEVDNTLMVLNGGRLEPVEEPEDFHKGRNVFG